METEIEIYKELLDSYRDYKLDLLEDRVCESIIYTQLQEIISKKYSLHDLYNLISGRDYIVIDMETLTFIRSVWVKSKNYCEYKYNVTK